MRAAHLYRVLAEVEQTTSRAGLFRQLAAESEGQAAIWAETATRAGRAVPTAYVPDRRTRVVAGLIRLVGPRAMRGVLAAMKVRGLSVYGHGTPGHPMPTTIGEMKDRHGGVAGGGTLRAAVFGANDGLVSNCCLILGVAGAGAPAEAVLVTGVAGLLAGAFSMASGEYVSVRAQREMFEHQISLERKELETYPDEEAEELALIYTARGMSREDARALAVRTIADPERALDTLAREELGLNPDELGSPWGAAIASFAAFAVGALIPLVPYAAGAGARSLEASLAITAFALFGIGAAISLFTGRSLVLNGLRMLAIGAAAGGATWGIGHLLGVALG
jgi:VIT1/CCC1 family predicted Fe2+/Mn2+ transporter